jgi:hypothetical protein
LALLTEKYPELQQIISAWPNLPEHIKQAVKTLVDSFRADEKEKVKE